MALVERRPLRPIGIPLAIAELLGGFRVSGYYRTWVLFKGLPYVVGSGRNVPTLLFCGCGPWLTLWQVGYLRHHGSLRDIADRLSRLLIEVGTPGLLG